jgi:23S rRNA maturation mini-RNase III
MREAPPSLDILYARLNEEVEGLREEVLEKDEAIRVLGRRVTEQDGEIARLLRKVVDAEEEAKMLRELRRALDEAEKSWMLAGEDDMMEQ